MNNELKCTYRKIIRRQHSPVIGIPEIYENYATCYKEECTAFIEGKCIRLSEQNSSKLNKVNSKDISHDKMETIGIGKTHFSKAQGGNTNESFPAPARNNPYGLFRVATILMNRRRRFTFGREPYPSKAKSPGDGNSGHLKWEPYPFQMSDAIARFRISELRDVLTMFCNSIDNILTCQNIDRTLSEYPQNIVKTLLEIIIWPERNINHV